MASKRRVTDEAVPLGLGDFRWRVCPAGYVCQVRAYMDLALGYGNLQEGEVLVPRTTLSSDPAVWPELDWHDTPVLFRQFASIEPGPAGALAFADKYGLLGPRCLPASGVDSEPERATARRQPVTDMRPAELIADPFADLGLLGHFMVEPLAEWRLASLEMRSVLGAWDALAAGKEKELRKWVSRPDDMDASTARAFAAGGEEAHGTRDQWYMVYRSHDGVASFFWGLDPHDDEANFREQGGWNRWEAARRLALHITNSKLAYTCYPHVMQRPRLQNAYTVKVRPKNLLGLLWWQFAMFMSGEASYRPCKVCGKLIQLAAGGEGFRSDKEFCSDRCKYKDFRDRKRKAKELKAQGRTIHQISLELDTDKATITNWLTKKK